MNLQSVVEEMPPGKLTDQERWDWKLNQLKLSVALKGNKKWGRERGTANGYADDAETKGFGKIASTIRTRSAYHLTCEQLALGGFEPPRRGRLETGTHRFESRR